MTFARLLNKSVYDMINNADAMNIFILLEWNTNIECVEQWPCTIIRTLPFKEGLKFRILANGQSPILQSGGIGGQYEH